jgi:hypothetical protein
VKLESKREAKNVDDSGSLDLVQEEPSRTF